MATKAMTISDRSPSIGRIFNRAFSVIRNNRRVTLGVAFLLAVLPQLVFSDAPSFDLVKSGAISVATGLAIAGGVFGIALVLLALVQGVIVHATVIDRGGGRAVFGESIRFAFGRILPLIAVSFLFVLTAIIGWSLLIIPFFFVVTRWAVAPSVAVAERTGVGGAFSRSADLTAGARWKILGLGFLVVIVIWLVSTVSHAISVAIAGFGPDPSNPVVLIVSAIANTLMSAFWAAMQASLYVELVDWKDGTSADNLAEIFA